METQAVHPLAPDHIPGYVAGADGSDVLFTAMTIFGIALIIGLGVLYLTLHAIPERMAHKSSHPQLQIVGILALLALFTHNNLFWVAAVLVAGFQFPDMLSPLQSIARSLASLAGRPVEEDIPEADAPSPTFHHRDGEG
ncbi:hypothetical protein CLG85_012680 [Yangia mangrovi]|uniref:Uncharacterized protein n=1 Tax=Alloyangia mangrovi TaxID=1779329 RepID=A0A2A3JVG4_9RHOB|nr:hypothetical protein [Alloyangia pacifica]MCA0947569.1 hypothetical protein [Alloyangia pacifica]MCT4371125.1 hypothetical protein [Alloyangia mangrovi]